MGIRKVLHSLDGPTLLCCVMHVVSTTAVPVMTKLLITQIRFPYPATLALTQATIIAICLWFWTIFGVYKVRVLRLRTILPLAATATLSNLLQLLALAHNSLLHYQVARLLPLAIISSPINAFPLLSGSLVLLLTHTPSPKALAFFIATIAATLLDRASFMAKKRRNIRASELQLQLAVRTLVALFTIPAAPLLDDYSASSPMSIRLFPFDESVTILIFSTGVAAFFSFVAVRASANRLPAHAFRGATLLASLAVFITHFVVYSNPFSILDGLAITLVLAGTFHLTVVADVRTPTQVANSTTLPLHASPRASSPRRLQSGDTLMDPARVAPSSSLLSVTTV